MAPNRQGEVEVHEPTCKYVRMLADLGEPVATLIECAKPPPKDLSRHSCWRD